MALKLVKIDPRANAKAEVVKVIKDALEQAEAGDLIDFAYAASCVDGSVQTGLSPTDDSHRRISAVSRLLHRLHMLCDEQMKDVS